MKILDFFLKPTGRKDPPPDDSEVWFMPQDSGRDKASGEGIPEGFDQWDKAGKDGFSLAHKAARAGKLPEGFDRWDLRDEKGWTVAHVAAMFGSLPEGFTGWELANEDGWSNAHAAAMGAGAFPEGVGEPGDKGMGDAS